MSDDTTTRQLVVFSLGEEEYALPIDRVQEIVFYTSPRTVSSGAPWVAGVISLRGKIIAVYDLAVRPGVAREQALPAKIVIVEAGADRAGVVVDDVAGVLTVSDADLEELTSATEHELVQSIAKVGDRLVLLLDLDHLVAGGAAPASPLASVGA